MSASLLERLAHLSPERRARVLAELPANTDTELGSYWPVVARPAQLSPWSPSRGDAEREAACGRWMFWLQQAGRGAGKTRSGSETIHEEAEALGREYGPTARIALIARTAADVRDTMVEVGDSAILNTAPPGFRPLYEPSKRRLSWPNGVVATTFTGDEPEALRGPQHHLIWADELAAWKHPRAWDLALDGLRLGRYPRAVITTTPKRGAKTLKDLRADPACLISRGATFDNASNLPRRFLRAVLRRYKGTTLGRQEIYGEELEAVEGALWQLAMIDPHRVEEAPTLHRVVIGVDPPGGRTECGIVAVGAGAWVRNMIQTYVLADVSRAASPNVWARAAIDLALALSADCIVAEANYGGDMVESTVRNALQPGENVRVKIVHATRGKAVRAEPVVGHYEQGRAHHLGLFPELESEMMGWVPGESDASPNRVDALVWAHTELMGSGSTAAPSVGYASRGRESQIRGG